MSVYSFKKNLEQRKWFFFSIYTYTCVPYRSLSVFWDCLTVWVFPAGYLVSGLRGRHFADTGGNPHHRPGLGGLCNIWWQQAQSRNTVWSVQFLSHKQAMPWIWRFLVFLYLWIRFYFLLTCDYLFVDIWSYYLPYLYSCISFLGVIILMCEYQASNPHFIFSSSPNSS